jgi:imidazolonepropionase-like amidohydrolase
MIAHGLSAAEALAAATSGGAYALGLADNIGTVAKGRTADLLILDGDPLSRPELLSQRDAVWLVMKGGRQVAGTALERTVGAADRRRDSAGPHG